MRTLPSCVGATTLTLLAVLAVAAPAQAVKPVKLRPLGPVKLVKPFKGGKSATSRPSAAASAVIPRGGFEGESEPACCHGPSEIGGAVSDTQVVQVDAAQVSVFSRTGTFQKSTPVEQFCGSSRQPRVLYDRFLRRWFIVAMTNDEDQTMCVFASKTSSASGAYHVVAFNAPGAGGLSRDLRIGMDTDALFLVYDQYDDANAYARTGAIAFSKGYIANGEFQPVGFYDGLPRLTPPVVVDARKPSSYFLAAGVNSLELWKATGLHRGGELVPQATIPVPAYSGAIFAQQPGTSDPLLTGSAHFKGSSYQTENRLINAHTINRNGWPTVRWYAINVDDSTILRSGRLFESPSSDDFAPSVAAHGDSVFFSWTSTDARAAQPGNQHGPRMRFATFEFGEPTTNRTGVAAKTGTIYTPTPGTESPWSGGQVALAPKPAKVGCARGTYAFALGPFARSTDRWQAFVKKFSTC